MNEVLPPESKEGHVKQELKKRLIDLATELSQHSEKLFFPGVSEEAMRELQAVDEKYPGYTTPIDELVERMRGGVLIVLGEDPDSGNVFVVPASGGDVGMDSIFPRHLDTAPEMNESLRSLILTQRAMFELEKK